jgi:hypothetical protein
MIKSESVLPSCLCGRPLTWDAPAAPGDAREITCPCGRKYELALDRSGRATRSEPLTPEARQPLAGFSPELKLREDCQRYHFSHTISGHRLPVHILFSPSAEEAEVKTGDRKALRFAPVRSALDARRRWIEWFDSRPGQGQPSVQARVRNTRLNSRRPTVESS